MDRLVVAVEKFLGANEGYHCTAQIGDSGLQLTRIEAVKSMSEREFRAEIQSADVVVSHAGMGNVLLAKEMMKPIIVMARRELLGENVNDHQVESVKGLKNRHYVYCIDEEAELESALLWAKSWQANDEADDTRRGLVSNIRNFLSEDL